MNNERKSACPCGVADCDDALHLALPSAQSKDDVDRAKRWFRNFEIFDPNGRGQARYPTNAQIENVAHSLAGQFAAVRAEALQKKSSLPMPGAADETLRRLRGYAIQHGHLPMAPTRSTCGVCDRIWYTDGPEEHKAGCVAAPRSSDSSGEAEPEWTCGQCGARSVLFDKCSACLEPRAALSDAAAATQFLDDVFGAERARRTR